MSSPITEADLHAYVDGVLDSGRRAEVEVYLAVQPDVAQRVLGYAKQREALREALAPIAEEPIPLSLGLAKMLEARRRRSFVVPWRFAAVAVFLLGVGGAGGWFLRGSQVPRGVAALAEEATDSYEVYGPDRVRPVELRAADSAQLVGWVSQRLKAPVSVPDLTASGYRFMGGRLVPTTHGPAGLFMYDDDHGTRLVMLVRQMTIDSNTTTMSEHSRGAVSGFTWANNGIGYSLVGPASPERLHPLANEIRRQIGTAL